MRSFWRLLACGDRNIIAPMRCSSLAGTALAVMLFAARAEAAPAWIYRGLTLPRGDIALDLGLGYGHEPIPGNRSIRGFGMNLARAAGVTPALQRPFRTG